MKKRVLVLVLALVATLTAFRSTDEISTNSIVAFRIPAGWPRPQYDFGAEPLREQRIALGRALFFDPRLSRDGTISCASCHLPQTAFTHVDHDLSHGIGNRIGRRNSPALVNLAWGSTFMWDGAVHHLEVQSLSPITNPDEMDNTMAGVVQALRGADYRARFVQAFGDTAITGERVLKSLTQYLLTLVSADAKYDRVMRAQDTFIASEARGYALFHANCASCHTEPLFTSGGFENNGLPRDTTLNDAGREGISGRPGDAGKFKVPTLRNVAVSYPYMHDGRFRSLQMVLFHYTDGIHQSSTLAPALRQGLKLDEANKRDLIAFLKTLTDEAFLHNAAYLPEPP